LADLSLPALYDPQEYQVKGLESLRPVCTAADFPDGQTRQIDGLHPDNLCHAVYPGGISVSDGCLYVGTRDAALGKIPIATH